MKFFAIVLVFFPMLLTAQFAANLHTASSPAAAELHLNNTTTTNNVKYNWKRGIRQAILPGTLAFASGVSGGLRESLLWRKDVFFKRFPNAYRNFWAAPTTGADAAAGTQPYSKAHKVLTTSHNIFLATAVVSATIPLVKHGKKEKLSHKLMDIGLQSLAISVGYFTGFEGTFSQFFKR
jgi:hypothetical protein